MIQFNQSILSYDFIFTLNEAITVNEPTFLFVFTHVLTKDQVTFLKTQENDNSEHPERYNSFTVDTTLFTHVGEWHYTVTQEQHNVLLESGKMIIDRDFEFTMYDGATSYKAYGL